MAVAYDNSSSNSSSATVSSLTVSLTVGSGSNRVLFVGVGNAGGGGGVTPSGVTFNSVSMTQVYTANGATFFGNSGWVLVNPPTGTYDVVVTLPSAQPFLEVCAISLDGVDQTTPNDTPVTQIQTSSNNPTETISSAADDMVVGHIFAYWGSSNSDAGQTNRQRVDAVGTVTSGALDTEAGASSVTMGWSQASSSLGANSIIGLVNFKAASGGGGTGLVLPTMHQRTNTLLRM